MITHRVPRALTKPLRGTPVNWASPFARKLLLCVPCSEGAWNISAPGNGGYRPAVLYGSVAPRDLGAASIGSAPTWNSNTDGPCIKCVTNDFISLGPDFIGTDQVTIAVIRRKHDTTARDSAVFGFNELTAGHRCGAHVPYSDGTVYWDFGGLSGANRLTVAGLTFTTAVERWVFTAGPRGSAIWRNGLKLASQGTAITRTASPAPFLLNFGNGAAGTDLEDFNFFLVVDDQWDDTLIRAWSADPYALLYPPSLLRVDDFVGGGTSTFPWQRAYSMGFR